MVKSPIILYVRSFERRSLVIIVSLKGVNIAFEKVQSRKVIGPGRSSLVFYLLIKIPFEGF